MVTRQGDVCLQDRRCQTKRVSCEEESGEVEQADNEQGAGCKQGLSRLVGAEELAMDCANPSPDNHHHPGEQKSGGAIAS